LSSKIFSLVNLTTLPKDLQKLMDEPIDIIKGIDEKVFDALKSQGFKKIKDIVQIKNVEKFQKTIDPLTLDKLVTTARIIDNIANKVEDKGKKIVLAGLDAAGKTTIINSIMDPKYKPGDEKPTKGLNFQTWDLFGFSINVWDLGGQMIYRQEYLSNSERHFGFTHLFIYVIDIQAQKRFPEAYDYIKRISDIFRQLDEQPYCLILLHKSDPQMNPKDLQKRTEELKDQIKKILTGFQVTFCNTSAFNRGSLFHAFSKGLREISVAKTVLSKILGSFQQKINAASIALFDKTGICLAEIGNVQDILKNFTINVILGEELGIFPLEASKLTLTLRDTSYCTIERIVDKERFYLAWQARENPESCVDPPLIKEIEPWIVNFLQ
jgi:small GTP-binding protein